MPSQLELLQGTDAAIGLQQELRAILHDSQAEMIERQQAYRNLDAISENDDLVDFDISSGRLHGIARNCLKDDRKARAESFWNHQSIGVAQRVGATLSY